MKAGTSSRASGMVGSISWVFLVLCAATGSHAMDLAQFRWSTVKEDTGFEQSTLQYVWDKYSSWHGSEPGMFGRPGGRQRNGVTAGFHFYCVFVHIHKYPQQNWLNTFSSRCGNFKMSFGSTLFYEQVLPLGKALAEIISEIDYSRRLHPNNHVPHLPYHATAMVDTLPIYVPQSHSWFRRRFLFPTQVRLLCLQDSAGHHFHG